MDPTSNERILRYMNVDGSDYTIIDLGPASENSSRNQTENKRVTDNCKALEGAEIDMQEHQLPTLMEDLTTSTIMYSTTKSLEQHITSFEKSPSTVVTVPFGKEHILKSFGRRGRPPKTSTPLASGANSIVNLSVLSGSRLNSSGEETSSSISDASGSNSTSFFLRVPDNSPVDACYCNVQNSPLFINQCLPCSEQDAFSAKLQPAKAVHNENERKRRTRIKNACDQLRMLVPSLNDKSDNATVLEATVSFLLAFKQNNPQIFSNANSNSM